MLQFWRGFFFTLSVFNVWQCIEFYFITRQGIALCTCILLFLLWFHDKAESQMFYCFVYILYRLHHCFCSAVITHVLLLTEMPKVLTDYSQLVLTYLLILTHSQQAITPKNFSLLSAFYHVIYVFFIHLMKLCHVVSIMDNKQLFSMGFMHHIDICTAMY